MTTLWTRAALVVLTGLALGCGSKPEAAKKATASGAAATPATAPVDEQAPAAAPAATPDPAKAPTEPPPAAPDPAAAEPEPAQPVNLTPQVAGVPDPKLPMVSRETLAKAYKEIYCVQRKGEADKLAAIFERYGFKNPRAWTSAWTEAVKDQAWVARLTQEAMAACPDP